MCSLINLRPYQVHSIEEVGAKIHSGKRRVLLVLPTGGGKTVIAARVVFGAVGKGKRCLFVAHRRELIRQTFCKLIRMGLSVEQVGIVMASTPTPAPNKPPPTREELDRLTDRELWALHGRRRPGAAVQVASISTLRNRAFPEADVVIVDEAHRALAASYKKLAEAYPKAVILGLTATPIRDDGKGLDDAFDDIVIVASPSELMAEGFLVAPKIWTVPKDQLPDVSKVKITRGDFAAGELTQAVDRAKLVGSIVDHWKRRGGGHRTVVFAASVEHSKHIAQAFVEAGVAAEHLDGTMATEDRDAILERLDRGETLVVCNCAVLVEGWDQPSVKTLVLACPTQSLAKLLQMAGRILRPWNGVPATILDHAGSIELHGPPQLDREWSLDAPKKRKGGAREFVHTCKECMTIWPLVDGPVCPECGWTAPPPERKAPEQVDGELVEFEVSAFVLEERARYQEIVDEWHKRNAVREIPVKPGWCFVEFRRRYKRLPPKGSKWPRLTAEQKAAIDRHELIRANAMRRPEAKPAIIEVAY